MSMGNLQKMAMQMQQDMARAQRELETATVEGTARSCATQTTSS